MECWRTSTARWAGFVESLAPEIARAAPRWGAMIRPNCAADPPGSRGRLSRRNAIKGESHVRVGRQSSGDTRVAGLQQRRALVLRCGAADCRVVRRADDAPERFG